MTAYNILEARNNLSRLIASVESGAEVTITRRGRPVAKLVPVDDTAADPRRPNLAIGEWLQANPLPEHLARSTEELDTLIEELRGSVE